MKYNFKPESVSLYFPGFRWEFSKNDYVGICDDPKYGFSPESQTVVQIKDALIPQKDGKWEFNIWQGLPSTYKYPELPDSQMFATLPGYFGTPVFVKNLIGDINNIDDYVPAPDSELPLVVAVCGPSGCGKTTLTGYLEKEHKIKSVVSYTTRDMRSGEENGREHHFVKEYDRPEDELAYTYFGGNHYWARISDLNQVTTYTIDEAGIECLLKLQDQGKIRVLWIQIERPLNPTDTERLSRDDDRKDAQKRLSEKGITPDIVIINDYPDAETFVKEEGEELSELLKLGELSAFKDLMMPEDK